MPIASITSDRRRLELAAVLAILIFGVVLRTIQYGAMGSMWLDELAIALNVTERSLSELLLRSLDHGQVAPPGFLALEKAGVWLLDPGEAGLRLFPWLAGIGALVLFWRLAARAVDGIELHAGLLVFAASPTLVLLGASAKQYSGDAFVTLLLLALRVEEERGACGKRSSRGYSGEPRSWTLSPPSSSPPVWWRSSRGLARADAETYPHPRSTSDKLEPQGCGYSRQPHAAAASGE